MTDEASENDGAGGVSPKPHSSVGVAPRTGVEYSVSMGESFSHDADHRYHTLQYSFRPGSILNDEGHDGQILLSGEKNAEQARVEFQHRKGGGRRVVCRGKRRASRDNEVLLIFDPRAHRFVLERVSGVVSGLRHERDPEDLALADEENSHVAAATAAAANCDESDTDDSLSDLDSDSDSVDDGSAGASVSASARSGKGSTQQLSLGEGEAVAAKRPRLEKGPARTSARTSVEGDSSDLSDSD